MPGRQMNRNPDTSKNWLKLLGLKRSPSACSRNLVTQGKKAISVFHAGWINQMMYFCVHAGVDLSGNISSVAKILY